MSSEAGVDLVGGLEWDVASDGLLRGARITVSTTLPFGSGVPATAESRGRRIWFLLQIPAQLSRALLQGRKQLGVATSPK